MPSPLTKATYEVTAEAMPFMALRRDQLPPELRHFEPMREGVLDNEAMAQHGFFGSTGEELRRLGRITGYIRELGNPAPGSELRPGTDLAAATVVHLFEDELAASHWIGEVFLREFEENAGKSIAPGQELMATRRIEVSGFAYEAAAISALQRSPIGLVSSTVVDFRVGRLLGVAYVVSAGDCARPEMAEPMARELEKQMVRVVLGSA